VSNPLEFLGETSPFHTALQVFKIMNRISPSYLHGIFSFAVEIGWLQVQGCAQPTVISSIFQPNFFQFILVLYKVLCYTGSIYL